VWRRVVYRKYGHPISDSCSCLQGSKGRQMFPLKSLSSYFTTRPHAPGDKFVKLLHCPQFTHHYQVTVCRTRFFSYLTKFYTSRGLLFQLIPPSSYGPEWLSRYSDSLRAVRGSNPIGGGGRFSAPSRPALGPTQPPIQWIPSLSQG
jgi:hypothetical protein